MTRAKLTRTLGWLTAALGLFALSLAVRDYYGGPLPMCPTKEGSISCAREWLSSGGAVLIGVATLILIRRQTRIGEVQNMISDRLARIAEKQHKQSNMKELIERNRAIDDVSSRIGQEFMVLEKTIDVATARSIVYNLTNLITSPDFLSFTPPGLRDDLRFHLGRHAAYINAASWRTKEVTDVTETLLNRVFEQSLEAQAGWETTYEGLIGVAMPDLARVRLKTWKADTAAKN